MAVAMQVNDILAARIWTTLDDQSAVNTYNYECISVTGGGITDQDLSNSIDTLWATFYKGVMSIAGKYNGVQVYYVKRSGSLPSPVKTTSSAGAGLSPNPTVPPNAAAIFKYQTFVRGPSGRGRVFLPFLATANMAPDGRPTSAFDTALAAQAALVLAPLTITSGGNSATLAWVLVHRQTPPTPPTATQITQAESAGKFGQMHKRGSYGRPNASPI